MKLSGKLQEWWFEANPYDSCVVNHKQCTIGWHVDDVRCSHVDPMVMEHMIDLMSKEFGKDAPLTVSCDKVHEYLGMPFYFTEEGAITIDMSDYVKTIIADMPEEMIGKAPTPAAITCFKSEKGQYRSKKEKADSFHKIHKMVMQLQYLSQRGRPDVRTAVLFLCKPVSAPDEDDYSRHAISAVDK